MLGEDGKEDAAGAAAEDKKRGQEDLMVLSIIHNSLETSILEAYSYCETSKELWDTLQKVYGNVSNINRVFEVKRTINTLSQEDTDFDKHFGKFRSSWAELEMDCENAQEIFKQMVSCGVPPNIWTYNILLDGFCDNGKLEKALVIFKDMQNSEMELGIITYTIVIEGMCRASKVEDAWELFCSLDLKGVKPDVRTYTIMISGFCVKRLKQEAVALFRKMKEDGPLPNDHTYNVLIRAHLRDGDKAASAELIKGMRSFGFSAEASTFGLVTNMLHDGRLDKSFLDMLS
ncbi:hypothetical protein Bca101_029638 [Brassica carinata]